MNYTFKLARRLALAHIAIAMAVGFLALSCAPGQPLEGGLEPPPDSVVAVQLYPDSVSLQPTEYVDFTAVGDFAGGGNGQVAVDWTASGGTITSGGRYTAGGTTGTYYVVGKRRNGKSDTSTVVIKGTGNSTPVLTGISVSPSSAALQPSASQQFAATGVMSDGSTSSVSVTWATNGGTVTSGGLYTAPSAAGSYLVIATEQSGTLADTALISVTTPPATLSAVVLSPGTSSLQYGQTQQFQAQGQLTDGSLVSLAVTWTATGGTVSSSGLYTAGKTAGTFRVVATAANGLADTSSVTVTAPTITSIVLTPATVSLVSGTTQQFAVTANLSNGTTQSGPTVTWQATGGNINSTGLYTAGTVAGTFRVIATASNGVADTSSVTISLPTITSITVTPATVTLSSGQTQQFAASATLSNGGTSSNPTVTWTATGGTISTSGFYTAGSTGGTFRVVATSGNGKADTSAVTIGTVTVTGIVVTPGSSNLVLGQTQQFSATAILSNGTTQSNPSVTWSATGGSISSSGLYTAGSTTGSFRVVAVQSAGTLADTSAVSLSTSAPSSMYFNSAEPGCGTDSNVVWCDDFEDGSWYSKNCDQANASGGLLQTDGWCGTIYADSYMSSGAQCGSQGAAGTNCTAFSGLLPGPNPDNTGNMGDHNLGPNNNTYGELYFRWYIKYSTDHTLNPQKTLTFNSTPAGSGGISIGGFGNGAGWAAMCPITDCGGSINNPQNTGCPGAANYYLCQNQNNNLAFSSVLGHWVYMEMHLKMNTAGNADGVYELWMNDCGTTGVCSGSPVLRARFTNVRWSTDGRLMQSIWVENQSPPPTDGPTHGSEWYDQIKVSRAGPIGFAP